MMQDDIFTVHVGISPLLISLPHDGSVIPRDLQERMQPGARSAPDTDWHVSRLYAFAKAMGATILQPKYSRYVIDLNRSPDDVSLYPGTKHHRFVSDPAIQRRARLSRRSLAQRT